MDKYYQFGEKNLGPLLLGYSKWLLENCRKEDIHKVYFFSRDGYLMKKAFDMLPGCKINIKTFYLEVSRRSLRVPILWKDYSLKNLLTMLTPSMLIPIASVFDAVGLNMDNYLTLLVKYGFDINSVIYRKDFLNNKQLKDMYSELSSDIKKVSLAEYANLKEYLKEREIGGKFAIVDIGWSGGMQRFLQTTLNEMGIKSEIYGYYTGIAKYYKRNVSDGFVLNMHGYLFDFMHNPFDKDCRNCFVGLYEMLFLENKGSVEKYVRNAYGQIEAVRYPYEYMESGELLPEVEHIKSTQEGALDYVKEHQSDSIDSIDKFRLCGNLLSEGQNPSSKSIKLFANFRFFDEGEYYKLARPRSLWFYLMHPSDFKLDFLKSRWKTAFLKRLLVIPLPYYNIYKLLKRIS